MSFIKRFDSNTPYQEIRREARLQRISAGLGLSPAVIRCCATSIVMENMNAPSLAQVYGDDPEDIPEWIREEILDILYALYTIADIEYIDVTPYNFIERDGIVWIIDFGHAQKKTDELHPYLDDIFASWEITKWNPDFA
jgi:RIO-like serine/threonine protein kinase